MALTRVPKRAPYSEILLISCMNDGQAVTIAALMVSVMLSGTANSFAGKIRADTFGGVVSQPATA